MFRYFNTIDHVCDRIYKNLDSKSTIILPDHVYVVKIGDLFDAFKTYFNFKESANIEQYALKRTLKFWTILLNPKSILVQRKLLN